LFRTSPTLKSFVIICIVIHRAKTVRTDKPIVTILSLGRSSRMQVDRIGDLCYAGPDRFRAHTPEGVKDMLAAEGVAVINIKSIAMQAANIRKMMWADAKRLSEGAIQPDVPSTYHSFSKLQRNGDMENSSKPQHNYFGHSKAVWMVRGNNELVHVFQHLWDTEDLLVSFDGIAFQPAPEYLNAKDGGAVGFYKQNPWPHLDGALNVTTVDPKDRVSSSLFQGLVTLYDVYAGDGTFRCWPGSHKLGVHKALLQKYGAKGGRIRFYEKSYLDEIGIQDMCLQLTAGDLIVFSELLVHCGIEPSQGRPNWSNRMVVYTNYVPHTEKGCSNSREAFRHMRIMGHLPGVDSKETLGNPKTNCKLHVGSAQNLSDTSRRLAGFVPGVSIDQEGKVIQSTEHPDDSVGRGDLFSNL